MECKNCGHPLTTPYCGNCGQKEATRLRTSEVLSTALDSMFNFHKGFFHTFLGLMKTPDKIINGYINGQRAKNYNPVKYLIISLAIFSFFMLIDETKDHYIHMSTEVEGKTVPKEKDAAVALFERYFNFFLFSVIPFVSLFSWWIFRKKKYNYAEHFTVNSFVFGQVNFISTFFLLLFLITPQSLVRVVDVVGFVVPVVYLTWVYLKTYDEALFPGILKSLLIFLLSSVVLVIYAILFLIIAAFKLNT